MLKSLALRLAGAVSLLAGAMPAIAACPDLPRAGNVRAYGWQADKLEQARQAARAANADTFMVITRGRIVLAEGDLRQPMLIASMRKSVMSALIGQAVAEGKLSLDRPITAFGINDPAGLSEQERRATVADLLHARSGIYIPASAETPRMKALRPARDSFPPGTHWYYNNWDFNVLGEIYQRATGKAIAPAVASRIAAPLCMQDFEPYRDSELLYDPTAPRFAAYHLWFSTRDTARLGLLYLNHGVWNGKQIVPRAWVDATTQTLSRTEEDAPLFGGYGGLWWTAIPDPALSPLFDGAFTASGFAGQQMTILPKIDTIILTRARERPAGTSTLGNFGRWQALVLKTLEARAQ